jgi:Ciliary basal body-associated, B9 protein
MNLVLTLTLVLLAGDDCSARLTTQRAVLDRYRQAPGLQALSTNTYTEQGWPQLLVRVDSVQHGLSAWAGGPASLQGYAIVPLCCTSGLHTFSVQCFRPFERRSGPGPAGAQFPVVHCNCFAVRAQCGRTVS